MNLFFKQYAKLKITYKGRFSLFVWWLQLDDWVLCRVRQKICTPRNLYEDGYGQQVPEPEKSTIGSMDINPNLEILKRENLFKDCPMLPFIFDSHLDFSSMNSMSSTTSLSDSKNSFDSPEIRANLEESSKGSLNDDRKRKETGEYEGFIDCNKKFRTIKDQNDEIGSLMVDTNEMTLYGGDQPDMWYQTYMMGYQDLNHLAFI